MYIMRVCVCVFTSSVSLKPFIKDGISERVKQDKDGVVWWQVSLSTCAIEKQMSQVVQTPHYWVIVSLGSTVT